MPDSSGVCVREAVQGPFPVLIRTYKPARGKSQTIRTMVRHHSAQDAMYGLFLIGFFAIFSTTISKNPVLPLFSQALGAGDAVIGLIAAVSPLAGILLSFRWGGSSRITWERGGCSSHPERYSSRRLCSISSSPTRSG